MGSLPSFRATGHKVWTRIRPNLLGVTPPLFSRLVQRGESEARLRALSVEVERLSGVRSNIERATQLARVLDAVSALAETHGLHDAELQALRTGPLERAAVTPGPLGLTQQLRQRATGVVAQVWGQGPFASITELAFGVVATAPVPDAQPVAAGTRPAAIKAPPPAHSSWRAWARTTRGRRAPSARSPVVVRVGGAAGHAGMQLIAASLLHLPRLHRQLVAVRRGADLAMQGAGIAVQGAGLVVQTARLVRLQATNSAPKPRVNTSNLPRRPERATATSLLLWSGRSSLQLTYEIASAGAQLILRRYVLPRVLRYLSSSVSRREIVSARPLRAAR